MLESEGIANVGTEVSTSRCSDLTSAMQSKMESEVRASVDTEVSKSKTESEVCASVGTEASKRKHVTVCTEAKHDAGRWRRSAGIGKGVGDRKRDREPEGEGSNAFVL